MDRQAIEARMGALFAFMEQAGKRLSASTIGKINSAIASLEALLGEEGSAGTDDSRARMATELMDQRAVTGRTTSDCLQAFLQKLSMAVYAAGEIPGSYKSAPWVWIDDATFAGGECSEATGQAAVMSESYGDGRYRYAWYLVDWSYSAETFAFTAVEEASAEMIVRVLGNDEVDEDALEQVEQAKKEGDYGPASEAGYADPGYQPDGKPRYPLKKSGKYDYERVKAAWGYINKAANARKYTAGQLARIKAKIKAAAKAVGMEIGQGEGSGERRVESGEAGGEGGMAQGQVFERKGAAPVLVQSAPLVLTLSQKRGDGTWGFDGVVTHGNVRNAQDQVYPTALWANHVADAERMIGQGRLFGSDGHKYDDEGYPRDPLVAELSHKFGRWWMDGDLVRFEAVTTKTPAGQALGAAFEAGIALEMSTRVRARVEEQKWIDGKNAWVVQDDESFELVCADVVVRGASPGSAIEETRLQKAGPRKEQDMTEEDIRKLIAQAHDAGKAELSAQLQAIKDELTAALEQGKVAALSEDQTATLEQAAKLLAEDAARKTATARDAKAGELVGAMVVAGEMPEALSQSAIRILCSMAQTPEEAETKASELKLAMAPMIQGQALLASKGIIVPGPYSPHAGDIHEGLEVQSLGDAIEELVQRQIEKGLVVDNGRGDFSNTARTMRRIARTLVEEKPIFGQAYFQFRNKRIRTIDQCRDLFGPGAADLLMQDIPAGATTTTDVAAAVPVILPIMMDVFPQLLAFQMGNVVPMTRSKATVPHWKVYDEDDADISDPDHFTGSYANDPGEKERIKRLKGHLGETEITTAVKKLGYDLSIEVMRHLRTDWNIDAPSVMVQACAAQIAREWNYIILAEMLSGATGGSQNYGALVPPDGSYDGKQWQQEIIGFVQDVRDQIYNLRFADSAWVIGEAKQISRITRLASEVGQYNGNGQGRIMQGIDIVGSLSTGERLVKVGWWNTLAPDRLLVGARGADWPQTGYVIGVYLGLYVTPPWVDPDTHDYLQSMQSEMAHQMLDGAYFGVLNIQEATIGVPL
jgi:hypothetical protein